MPSVKFPINVNLESIDGAIDRAKIVNGYAELMSAQEAKVYSRPALNLAQGSFAAFGQGLANTPDGKLFVISGGEVYFPVPAVGGVTHLSTNYSQIPAALVAKSGFLFFFDGNPGVGAGAVYRAASPYTAFSNFGTYAQSTIGTLVSALDHQGTFVVSIGTETDIRVSADGNAWSDMGNSPDIEGRIASHGGTLALLPLTAGSLGRFTTNFGATGWGTFTSTVMPVAQQPVSFNGALWAIGTGSSARFSGTGTGGDWQWAYGTGASGITQPLDFGHPLTVFNSRIYAVTGTGTGGPINVWSSPDGNSFSLAGTAVMADAMGPSLSVDDIGDGLYVLGNNDGSGTQGLRLFLFTDSGALTGITPLGSISIPTGEVSNIISLFESTTFVKTTTSAYTISSGVITSVGGQYPAVTVRGAVYLNGHLYVMEPDGTIWNSAEDDFTSWAGTDFITAEFEADGGVCIAKQGEYVIALGQFTTEAFYDAGNATGSPLDPVGSAVMLIGCAHANSVAQVETSLVWVAQQKGQGSTFHKGRFVAYMKGYGSYERISTPDMERVLDKDAFNEVYADILTIAGHVFYVLTLADTDITLVYDFRSQLWYEWSLATAQSAQAITSITGANALASAVRASHGYSDGDQVVVTGGTGAFTVANGTYNVNVANSGTFTYPISSSFSGTCTTGTGQGWTQGALDISASCYFDNSQLVQLRETGDVYVLDIEGTDDNGAPIDFHIRTRQWDGETGREKFMNGLEVRGDKVASTGLVRYWDEDFDTATKFKRVTLSLRRPRARRGGSFSRRAVEFRHTLSAKVGIAALEADIEMGEQ